MELSLGADDSIGRDVGRVKLVTKAATRSPSNRRSAPVDSSIRGLLAGVDRDGHDFLGLSSEQIPRGVDAVDPDVVSVPPPSSL